MEVCLMNKFVEKVEQALTGLTSGMTLLVGGFGLSGIPESLIHNVKEQNIKNLTVVSNNCGVDGFGLGLLLQNNQITKIIASYVGENKLFEEQFINGELEVELTPQGTLAERLRAGGAGIPAFYTATGVGTLIAEGKETKQFNGREYLLEQALTGDYAFVKAWKADKIGNCIFRKTARNFNPLVAKAATITIVEAEEIVEVGQLDPDSVHLPGIYVQYVCQSTHLEKRIERKTVKEGD